MLPRFLKIIFYTTLSLCFAALGYYYGQDIITLFKKFPLEILIALILLQIPLIAAGGLAFDFLAKPYHIQLQCKDWLGLSFIANLLNQFLPYRPGMVFRYWYLQHHYPLTASQYITIMFVYFALTVLTSTVFAIIGWTHMQIALPKEFNHLFILSCGIGIAIIFLWIFLKKNSSFQVLRPLLTSPLSVIKTLAVMGIMNLLTAFIFGIVFWAVGAKVLWSHCFFLVGSFMLATIFPITPGNIGVLETLAGTLTLFLYKDFALGFSAVILYRTSQWVPSLLLGSLFSFLLLGSVFPTTKNMVQNKIVD